MVLTLDVNVVRDVLDARRAGHDAAMQLVECARRHSIQLQMTNRLDVDVPGGPLRTDIDALSVLDPNRPGAPARIGFSRIGSPDFIVSEEDVEEGAALEQLLFPGATKEAKKHRNRLADVDHLMAHKSSGARVFVTNERSMLQEAPHLVNRHSISVLSPAGVVQQIEAGGLGE